MVVFAETAADAEMSGCAERYGFVEAMSESIDVTAVRTEDTAGGLGLAIGAGWMSVMVDLEGCEERDGWFGG